MKTILCVLEASSHMTSRPTEDWLGDWLAVWLKNWLVVWVSCCLIAWSGAWLSD